MLKMKKSQKIFQSLTNLLVDMLGKPKKFVSIQINPGCLMTFGGTADPCAMCYLTALGPVDKEQNKKNTQIICKKLETELNIAKDRIYITFQNPLPENVGWNDKIFG